MQKLINKGSLSNNLKFSDIILREVLIMSVLAVQKKLKNWTQLRQNHYFL